MNTIETITPAEATERLRAMGVKISPDVIREGIQQKIFPFGDCIITKDKEGRSFFIYTKLFDKWIEERASEREVIA